MLDENSLCEFGIQLTDEHAHAYSEDHADWNESYFFDWYDESGAVAGHCRIGWHPVQQRILFWLHVYHQGQWLIIEENRLPFSALDFDQDDSVFAYQGWGLNFAYKVVQPLLKGELSVSGFARVLGGSKQGMMVPIALTLNVTALGPAYSRGAGTVESHSAVGFSTNRYEQAHQSALTLTVDGEQNDAAVRGERDHSWGPRPWDMGWQFFVVNNAEFSLQATVVAIPEWPLIKIGYFHAHQQAMEHLSEAEFDLQFNADDANNAVSGSFHLSCDSGREVKGHIETIAGTEIDITHVFATPHRSEYRRSLVRCTFDDGSTSIGWLECNRELSS